jgi:hypothetical protein
MVELKSVSPIESVKLASVAEELCTAQNNNNPIDFPSYISSDSDQSQIPQTHHNQE